MKSKRLLLLTVISALALLTSGCEWLRWLRLLSLKKQLAEVERYVRVEDQDGLTLHFLKPVVYADDLKLLIEGETSRATNGTQMTWLWTFEKQSTTPNADSGSCDLSVSMLFENQKFSELRFPKPFLGLMPKPLIVGLLRSFGQAEIDMKRGTVKTKWVGPGPNQKMELPTKAQITALLGAPFTVTASNSTHTFLYKYYQKAIPSQSSPAERLAWGKFTFADADGQVLSSEGVIGNIGWTMTRVPNEPEPRITLALLPLTVEPVALKLPPAVTADYPGQYKATNGTVLNVGRDGEAFVLSWANQQSGGWCAALPELTNVLFGLPNGLPRCTFLQDHSGAVTGLVAQLQGSDTLFAKVPSQLPPAPAALQLEPQVYAACAGQYKASWGGMVFIRRQGEQLFWRNQGVHTQIPLYPSSETNFFFKAVDSPITFVRNAQGEVTKFILRFNGKEAEAVKVKKQ